MVELYRYTEKKIRVTDHQMALLAQPFSLFFSLQCNGAALISRFIIHSCNVREIRWAVQSYTVLSDVLPSPFKIEPDAVSQHSQCIQVESHNINQLRHLFLIWPPTLKNSNYRIPAQSTNARIIESETWLYWVMMTNVLLQDSFSTFKVDSQHLYSLQLE